MTTVVRVIVTVSVRMTTIVCYWSPDVLNIEYEVSGEGLISYVHVIIIFFYIWWLKPINLRNIIYLVNVNTRLHCLWFRKSMAKIAKLHRIFPSHPSTARTWQPPITWSVHLSFRVRSAIVHHILHVLNVAGS